MESWGGSSRESNVNSSSRETGGEEYISSRFNEAEDDHLLDLSDGLEPPGKESRLLFDFTSDRDTSLADDNPLSFGSRQLGVQSVTLSQFVSTASGGRLQDPTGNGDREATDNLRETISYADPMVVAIGQSGNAEPSASTCDSTAKPHSSASGTIPLGLLSRNSAAQMRVAGGMYYGDGSMLAAVELPDVSLRQPLLLRETMTRAAGDIHTGIRVPTPASYSPGDDYADDDDSPLIQRPRGINDSSCVMLGSILASPPSTRVRGAVSDSIYMEEGAVEEVHCHSTISKGKMNDKLARRQLLTVLVMCVLFMIGESIGGVLANSLALFTDVLHLASDLISYVISLLALYLSRKQATQRMTFGYHRAEVLGALFSVFIIWLVSGVLCYIAVERIINKHYIDVKPDEMLITASLGVIFNLIMGFVLHSEKCCNMAKYHSKFGHGHSHGHSHSHDYEPLDVASQPQGSGSRREVEEQEGRERGGESPPHKNLNVRAAFIHVVGDILQSLGVLVAALIIKLKEEEQYRLADPICTFLFSLLVLCTTISVLRDTLRIIMEGAPAGVNFEQLKKELLSVDGVVNLHDLNVWALTMDRNALSVHLAIDKADSSSQVLRDASLKLKPHNFCHLTIQVEIYCDEVMTGCSHCQPLSK